LIVDGPGNGESIRFRDLPLIAETEKYGAAAYDYLASRKEVDPKRIGVMAISLGGYYAPRAASLEPRYAACIAWGAQWDFMTPGSGASICSTPARCRRCRCRPST
jgi:dienelactone hydrolase